jgi:hypothetical protein
MVTSSFIASAMVKPSDYNIIPSQSMLYVYVYILRDIDTETFNMRVLICSEIYERCKVSCIVILVAGILMQHRKGTAVCITCK